MAKLKATVSDYYDMSGVVSIGDYTVKLVSEAFGEILETDYTIHSSVTEDDGAVLEADMTLESSVTDVSTFGIAGILNSACYETSSGTTLTGTIEAEAGDIIVATITVRSALTLPDNLTLLSTSDGFGDYPQTMSFAYEQAEESGTYSYTVGQASAGRIYLNLVALKGVESVSYSGDFHTVCTDAVTTVTPPENTEGKALLWGCSAVMWASSSPYGAWSVSPSLDAICLNQSSTAPRQANFLDGGTSITHIFTPITSTTCAVDALELTIKEGYIVI